MDSLIYSDAEGEFDETTTSGIDIHGPANCIVTLRLHRPTYNDESFLEHHPVSIEEGLLKVPTSPTRREAHFVTISDVSIAGRSVDVTNAEYKKYIFVE